MGLVRKVEIEPDYDKIELRKVTPSGLVLTLNKYDGNLFHINLDVDGGSLEGSLKWQTVVKHLGKISERKARRVYDGLLQKFRQGKYTIYLYTDGRADVEFSN